MYDSFENNNDSGNVSVYDNSFLTQEMQIGTNETPLGVTSGDSTLFANDTTNSLSVFQVDNNGYLLVSDVDLYQLFTEFKENFDTADESALNALNNLDKDIRILTGVILVFAFGFFMRLLIRRVFGRWFD